MVKEKFTKDKALAKIKVLIKRFYEEVGREITEDIDLEREKLLDKIENILENTDISNKQIIIETLKLDKTNNKKDVDYDEDTFYCLIKEKIIEKKKELLKNGSKKCTK